MYSGRLLFCGYVPQLLGVPHYLRELPIKLKKKRLPFLGQPHLTSCNLYSQTIVLMLIFHKLLLLYYVATFNKQQISTLCKF